MDLALVVGIIRGAALANAEKRLQEIGVRGITVTKGKVTASTRTSSRGTG